MSTDIEPWSRPDKAYFRPSPTTYYETTRRENRSRAGAVWGGLGVVGANGMIGWAAWSAHMACVNGNAHSIAAEAVIGALSAGSGIYAISGFISGTERGSWAGTLLAPISLFLAGFGVLLWSPGWAASAAGALIAGALNGGLGAVVIKLKREERQMNHAAGMQYDAITGALQRNWDTQQARTERRRLKFASWFHAGRVADARVDQAVYDLHLRHPDTVAAPERYASRELPAGRQPLAITAGAEPADDWMALADVLTEHVETR